MSPPSPSSSLHGRKTSGRRCTSNSVSVVTLLLITYHILRVAFPVVFFVRRPTPTARKTMASRCVDTTCAVQIESLESRLNTSQRTVSITHVVTRRNTEIIVLFESIEITFWRATRLSSTTRAQSIEENRLIRPLVHRSILYLEIFTLVLSIEPSYILG